MVSARTAGYLALGILVLQNSLLALTMRLSRTVTEPNEMYFASTAVLVCEVLKLSVSMVVLVFKESAGMSLLDVLKRKVYADPFDVIRLLVPAGLYTVQNNLAYFAMTHLDAATYQVFLSTDALCM